MHVTTPELDLRERGAPRDGTPQFSDRRLFMQLLAFECRPNLHPADAQRNLAAALEQAGTGAVLYEDVNHPAGLAVLSWTENPLEFSTVLRPALNRVQDLELRSEFSMLGRTYSSGFETDLDFWLLQRPIQTVLNLDWPWAIWYPLRRSGDFEQLDPKERGSILHEHALIGKSYGTADLAHDVRLACHGLDASDNEFVIGLVGKDLYPLSHVIQSMRRTRQTAEYISQMGPFFVGRAVWRRSGSG